MFYASLTNRIIHSKQETKTVTSNYTLEEFKEIMIDKSPTAIFHSEYSKKSPCWNITKLIMPSEGGVWVYASSAADKTPRFRTWEQFYNELAISGFDHVYF